MKKLIEEIWINGFVAGNGYYYFDNDVEQRAKELLKEKKNEEMISEWVRRT